MYTLGDRLTTTITATKSSSSITQNNTCHYCLTCRPATAGKKRISRLCFCPDSHVFSL